MGNIFHNRILMTTLIVWAIAQVIKVLLGVIREKRFDFKWFIGTGGMPSSHAAGATALATSCALEVGVTSVEFALATVFAIVTMFDAQGVRRSSGQQAVILNRILDEMYREGRLEADKLLEFLGHSPLEVILGALLGMFMSFNLYLL